VRRPAVGITLVLSVIALFNLFSVGSTYFEPVRNVVDAILPDPTFTGRTDVWRFALDHLAQRPLTGYGFSAFWGTDQVVYGMGEGSLWANTAGHAHNSYLNLALTIGLPGAVLVTLWLVVLPLVDFYRTPRQPATAPLQMLLLRVCLFAACQACFENTFFGTDGFWLFLVTATFGLRFLAVSRPTL
jgi:O-antigen ligase